MSTERNSTCTDTSKKERKKFDLVRVLAYRMFSPLNKDNYPWAFFATRQVGEGTTLCMPKNRKIPKFL